MAGKLTPEVSALALQGTLDTFSLPDVLRLLATTSKTGRLRIEGDRGLGSVWLADGGIVDADADRAIDGTPTDEVVFELLRFSSGSFAFDGDDTASATGEPEDVEALLRRANALLSEWTELENVVPSLEHEVSLAGDLSVEQVTIDADRWRSLVAVASGRTVGELATALGLTELGVSRAVRDLVDLGVAEVGAPGSAPARDVSRRPQEAASDLTHRPSLPTPDPAGPVGPIGRPAHLTGEVPRAGWRQTGEVPVVGSERRSAPTGNGHARASLDDTVATPPPAGPAPASPPAEPPSKGGLASRLGRNRNASPAPRAGEATTGSTAPVTGSTPPVTGATPPVDSNGTPPTSRPPVAPPARTNDTGRDRTGDTRPRNGTADTGPVARTERPDLGTPRRSAPEGPNGLSGPGRPTPGPAAAGPGATSPFDAGRLGPSPRAHDTGQIRPITPSSLPPDLHWAADDTDGGSINGGPTSPFSGLSSLGPAPRPGPGRPGRHDGEIAPHVAAMSPEARAAVQSTVGNAGGSTGRGSSQGEDIAQRGRLISFLSTVR
jgi:hypothetical protein